MAARDRARTREHCPADGGLMAQLRARAALRVKPHHPPLPVSVFLWESPPLGARYKITFLVRLEADGQEAVGFRFDDTVSESPRQIAWGGMVGTPQSPRCFLDGSQTFLTDSASKPIERCRSGWHVRIGKVSQIVSLFENTPDSLLIKLSLRKIHAGTHITHLLSQPQPPVSLQAEKPHQSDLRSSRNTPSSSPTKTHQKHWGSASKLQLLPHPNPHILPVKSPITPPLLLHSSCKDYTTQEAPRRFQSSPSPSNISPHPTNQIAHRPSHHHISAAAAASTPLKPTWTTNLPRSVQPSPKSSVSARPKTPNVPSYNVPAVQTSPKVLSASSATYKTPPRAPTSSDRDGRFLEASLSASLPGSSERHQKPDPDDISNLAPEISPSTKLNTPMAKITPPSPNPPAATQVDLSQSKPSLSALSTPTALETALSTGSHTFFVPNAQQETPPEMVCFLFPPNANRASERRLYVPHSALIKVEYFKQALESPNPTLSIDTSRSKLSPPFQIVKHGLLAFLRFIPGLAFQLHRRLAPSPTAEVPATDVQNNNRVLSISLDAMSRIGLGLVTLAYSSCLDAMKLLFDESCKVMDALIPQPQVDATRAGGTTTAMKILFTIRVGLGEICHAALTIQKYLTELGCVFGDDSDDELESENVADDVQAPSIQPKVTFTINHIAYPTLCGVADYLQYGAIKFAPLHSNFVVRKASACTLSQDDSRTVPLGQEFSSQRRAYIHSHSRCIALHGFSNPQVRLTPCNPASIYALASRLRLEELKSLANRQIMHELSPINIFRMLKTASSHNHKQLY
ncbi:hypothetical protein PtA15_11A23 [Puccinia triticina]|uniref:Uncharacterized protein n=1 Tax=Puccinia triticina TaxID=208348 RepID=A0ABY7CYY9_9BASI|nr:uncharacterized protein PtA15_11A23 [Puccinia triticina]WAQ89336.1 hypothetical protein PtA15_11A23 [Puccinia triticina]WAR59385.1 hypothetical protein PtB15_11B25 [Puccinia triticina]